MDFYAQWLKSNFRVQQVLMENYQQGILVGLNVADQLLIGMSKKQASPPQTRRMSYHREGNVLFIEHITPLFSLKSEQTAQVHHLKKT